MKYLHPLNIISFFDEGHFQANCWLAENISGEYTGLCNSQTEFVCGEVLPPQAFPTAAVTLVLVSFPAYNAFGTIRLVSIKIQISSATVDGMKTGKELKCQLQKSTSSGIFTGICWAGASSTFMYL